MNHKPARFRGVSYERQRKRWRAECRPASFLKLCQTEMEACAHYTAVAKTTWPDSKSVKKLLEINNPWNGRPVPPRGWNRAHQRVIDIDHEFCTIVDDFEPATGKSGPTSTYSMLKDFQWFVRGGRVLAITACGFDEEWQGWWFEYLSMEEWVFGGPCAHRNGDPLDNRISNLVSLAEAPAEDLAGEARLSEA